MIPLDPRLPQNVHFAAVSGRGVTPSWEFEGETLKKGNMKGSMENDTKK